MRFPATFSCLALLLVAPGCVGLTGGPTPPSNEPGLRVQERLEPGMTVDDALAVLGEGGAVFSAATFDRGEDGVFTPADPEQAHDLELVQKGLASLDEAGRERVTRALALPRSHGFFGYDVFYLYLDADDRLVGHRLLHYN